MTADPTFVSDFLAAADAMADRIQAHLPTETSTTKETTEMTVNTATPAVDVAQLAAEYDDLRARRDQIGARMNDVANELRTALGRGTYEAGAYKVSISPNRRFDPDKARTVLPPELLAACSETVVSAAKARQILAPLTYEALMVEVGDDRISVK